jgi:hypothetical protein
MTSDKKYEKKFAKVLCSRLQTLQPILQDFEAKWNEYQDYKRIIPSFGAVIFSKGFSKILFGMLSLHHYYIIMQSVGS